MVSQVAQQWRINLQFRGCRRRGLISESGRSPEERNSISLQYSCLRNTIERGTWRVTVHEQTWKSLSLVRLFATPWTIQCMEFSKPEYWNGQPFPSPGDLPNPGIKPRSPALRADYQLNHQGSPGILEWLAYPFSSRSSQPRNWTWISCIAGGFFTSWATREDLTIHRGRKRVRHDLMTKNNKTD